MPAPRLEKPPQNVNPTRRTTLPNDDGRDRIRLTPANTDIVEEEAE